ncbi:GTP pyrophosphokinase [Chryseobacterium herbae]|uniref:RelA/SpoT domain-containing protein n=1 Tax=Chryseobacterium herbae TaxID=2976476 RepID=A0ABT2INX9_9FLAO|nr:RelA/SpoT domain-containing protein [Chryseobacterium sp. pc1-10]MCT2560524.1 RelA/SpoT domain-containing protein [Chryseobacterium sp. pc1-10]
MAALNKEQIDTEYKQLHDDLIRFEKALITQIQEILSSNNITLGFPIQFRVKTVNSIIEKHESKRFTIKKSILELQDLVGFRIVMLFKRDIEKVNNLIEDNFEVIKKYDTIDKLSHDQFGYSSRHYIIKINKEWCNVPTFKNLDKYEAEIQIRTLSQHNWAETSNALQYKNTNNVPKEILRTIGRVAALLETVDLELERTLFERDEYNKTIVQNLGEDKKLDMEILKIVLDKAFPEDYLRDVENYSELLSDLFNFDIIKVEDLESLIRENIKFSENKANIRHSKSDEWIEYDILIVDTVSGILEYILFNYDHNKWHTLYGNP